MRIDKTSEPTLFRLYDEYQEYRKNNTLTYRQWKIDELIRRNDVSYDVEQFCYYLNIKVESEKDKLNLFRNMYSLVDEKMFGGVFNVEYVSMPFLEGVEKNVKKLLSSIAGESYFDALGECSGFLIINNYIVSYVIIENCSYFNASHRTTNTGGQQFFFGNHILRDTSDWNNYNELEKCISLAIGVLILKKYGEVETILVGSGVNRRIASTNENIFNKAPFKIKQLDCSWLRNIIRTEGFMVSGHFRLQPYGEGRSLRKLIYIEPFEKHGYTRTAKKLTDNN